MSKGNEFEKNIFSKNKIFIDGDSPKTQKVGKILMTENQRKNQGLLSHTIYMTLSCHMRA